MKTHTRHALLGAVLLSCIAAVSVIDAQPAEARSRSFSSPSRSYSAPKPAPRTVVNKTVVNRTTVIQQAAPAAAPAGGGFMGSFLGAAAGAGVTNAIMNSDNQSAPIDAPASINPVQCLDVNQKVVPCPAPEVK